MGGMPWLLIEHRGNRIQDSHQDYSGRSFRLGQTDSSRAEILVHGRNLLHITITVGILGLPAISTLMAQRDEKKQSLKSAQRSLFELNQGIPLELMDKLEGWRPDLDQMFDRMVTMAEVWSSVRSQAVQFRSHIEGGLDAATNMRFKNEVKLAREVCAPMKECLHEYMEGLDLYWNAAASVPGSEDARLT